MQSPDDAQVAALIRRLLAQRRPGQSICPSEVARALSDDAAVWRNLMPQVRAVAAAAAGRGLVRITQQGRTVDPATARGPIRLMRGSHFD
ncbi:hypothetical protein NY98_19250 [Xanthomonas citri pv. fuscans]|uniref:DUF3253 domain-containing protein n=3 Tax=Xanthomonas citri TaxID=346 RepID=A0AB33CKN9_XANCI|nr:MULTISPECIES: DUF3253 domain-containing protein [Xanthomonas]MBO9748421.1 DUF3253 domain-containing protein [Xanthomonas phaseoli pv. dieffenbachiae]MBO9876189.1 DUF3253 domain-containing protein [Xanthomonas sp. D-99]MBO9889414.1 DUF3253 domain-containing protein [Xanthomonas sp. D-36-1]MBV6781314.1 DUF3253 domain-containing protein [Xanthomonas campestris pv. trichodesmae]MBV6886702.1 DUF3253 domain-containing protein [Xanthomonas campestris pv. spermacoces]MEE5089441.1 DUF3253 domain-co